MNLPNEIQFISSVFKSQKTTRVRMDGKLCILTGATSGVGYQAAKRFAKGGASLVLVCRNPEKAENVRQELDKAYGTHVEVVLADFSRMSQVKNAASHILKNYPKIDVLINNAGVHRTSRILTEDGFEYAFAVNHLASFLFTRLLLDRLIENSPTRIIQVNSQGHRFGGLDLDDLHWEKRSYRPYQGYGASKVAQLLTVWELADFLKGTGVTINAIHPGAVKTNIGMDNGLLFKLYQKIFIWPILRKPEISGEAIYYLAAAPETQDINGKYFNRTVEEQPMPIALDREVGHRVFKLSEKLTGLPELNLMPE